MNRGRSQLYRAGREREHEQGTSEEPSIHRECPLKPLSDYS
jgi:hypothetical protein